jgi:predicted nucleic acid-binding Zn ribbon protein
MNAPQKPPRMCRVCGGPMPTNARRDAKACGQVCRQRAHRQRHAKPRPAWIGALELAESILTRLVDGAGVDDAEIAAALEATRGALHGGKKSPMETAIEEGVRYEHPGEPDEAAYAEADTVDCPKCNAPGGEDGEYCLERDPHGPGGYIIMMKPHAERVTAAFKAKVNEPDAQLDIERTAPRLPCCGDENACRVDACGEHRLANTNHGFCAKHLERPRAFRDEWERAIGPSELERT